MGPTQSNLSNAKYGYDLVVSVSQGSMNAAMEEYLSALEEPVAVICYTANENGDPEPIDYDELKQRARGSDPFSVPANADPATSQDLKNLYEARFMVGFKAQIGLPPGYAPTEVPDVVVLSGDASSVSYTLMCSEFTVVQLTPGGGYSPPSWMKVSQPSGKPWLFTSKVDLRLAPFGDSFSKLPPAVQAAIKNLGSGAFSVQQLLFDLDNAALESVPQIEGVQPGSDLYACLQRDFLGKYISTVKENGQPVLGCAVTQPADVAQPGGSGLVLTDLNFEVSPLLGDDGQPIANPTTAQQDLFTLNYLCAVNGSKLPGPAQFGWNWMEPGDDANFDGVMSINRDALVRYLDSVLAGFAARNCYEPQVRVWLDGLETKFDAKFIPGQAPTVDKPATGATVLKYSYTATSKDVAGLNGDAGQLTATPSYSLQVDFKDNTVIITQESKMYLRVQVLQTATDGNILDETLVDTYTIDVDENGKLATSLASNRTDNSQNLDVGGFVNFFTNINDLVDQWSTWVKTAFVQATLNDPPGWFAQGLVFPGGRTFVFKGASFSDHQDLLARITYADPT